MRPTDLSTVACEVPVYRTGKEIAYFKSQGFLQLRNGLIHLLDYKPKASTIHPLNQLVVCALAPASQTRLPLKALKCAWFDEMDYFELFPLEAVKARKLAPLLD